MIMIMIQLSSLWLSEILLLKGKPIQFSIINNFYLQKIRLNILFWDPHQGD